VQEKSGMHPKISRETIIAIGAGFISALLYKMASTGLVLGILLAYFALQPILLIGLDKGRRAVTIAMLSGVCGTVFLANSFQAILYGVSVVFPAWIIVVTTMTFQTSTSSVNKWFPLGEIVARLTALGIIATITSVIIFHDTPGGLTQSVESFLNELIANSTQFNSSADVGPIIGKLVPLFPAITVSSWLLMIIINTLAAHAILVKKRKGVRPKLNYTAVTAPEWAYWALVCSAVFLLTGSSNIEYVGRNLVIILFIPFLLVGLTVIHTFARRFGSPTIALVSFYALMMISSWPVLLTILVGFFEKWIKFREKFPTTDDKNNEE